MWKELGKHAVCRICSQELLSHLSRDYKKRIHGDECSSATSVDAVFQPYVSPGAAIESAAVKQTLTETKRLDTRPKYPKRCKEKYQKNLFRLSFKPDLAPVWKMNKD